MGLSSLFSTSSSDPVQRIWNEIFAHPIASKVVADPVRLEVWNAFNSAIRLVPTGRFFNREPLEYYPEEQALTVGPRTTTAEVIQAMAKLHLDEGTEGLWSDLETKSARTLLDHMINSVSYAWGRVGTLPLISRRDICPDCVVYQQDLGFSQNIQPLALLAVKEGDLEKLAEKFPHANQISVAGLLTCHFNESLRARLDPKPVVWREEMSESDVKILQEGVLPILGHMWNWPKGDDNFLTGGRFPSDWIPGLLERVRLEPDGLGLTTGVNLF